MYMSNILIDFTEELFSELRIPIHEVSLPLQWMTSSIWGSGKL